MSNPMKTDLRDRVSRGALMLDVNEPGWHDRVKLKDLDLEDPCACVWGQLRGDYYNIPDWVLGNGASFGFDLKIAESITEDELAKKWKLLTKYWRKEIKARRRVAKERMLVPA